MTFSESERNQRRRTYVRLIGEVHQALNSALAEEYALRGLTQTQMAETLGNGKSFVSRKMNGTSNMTMETLADLAYALDRVVKVALVPRKPPEQANYWIGANDDGKMKPREVGTGSGSGDWTVGPKRLAEVNA